MAVLLGAQEVAGASDLEVTHGQLEPRAQLGQFLKGAQPPLGLFVDTPVGRHQQIRERLLALAAHAAAQLVELGQTEAVGAVDDDRVRRRDVEPRLDDGGGHQDVGLAVDEADHGALQLALVHLAVRHDHARVGHQVLDEARHRRQRLHAIVHEEHLAAALQLALERFLDDGAVEAAHDRLDGQPVHRWRLDHRHVAHARERHIEGARDRRGRHGQHVHRGPQLLDPLLVGDAEAVLLVHDQQAEVLELDVLAEQPVGADDDVHRAVLQALDDLLLLLGRAEP